MLRVYLLGEQAITDGDSGAILARSPRTIALLGYLVVHAGRPQSRQRIAELFWPDSTDGQARTNLRRELHHLRQIVADERCLVVTGRDLCWQDTGTSRVDVRTFDVERTAAGAAAAAGDPAAVLAHGKAALDEYRGDFLPGGYDDWLLDVRADLEANCVALCDLLGETRARQGDLAGAIAVARRRVALRPLEEIGYRTLIRRQSELGDRGGALSTYHHCASILERELGVTPDDRTRALVRRLLARTGSGSADAAVPASGPAASPLVGRPREIAVLRGVWRQALAGAPGVVLVLGGAGVGKTRLLTELADAARHDGAVVAAAQCFGTSGRLAMTPVADWLRNTAVQSSVARLDPARRAEVERLVPSGAEHAPAAGAPASDAWQRHRFFDGLARSLLGVGRPLLLMLDNMQWCDQETLAFVSFCLRLATGRPLLVAGTLRDENQAPEVGSWARRMRDTGLVTDLPLQPLDVGDTGRLAGAIAGRPLPDADVALLHATTGGFPLYVVEAVRSAIESGGNGLPVGDLTAVLRTRLDQVSPPARAVAGLAAAVGRDFPLALLTEASRLDADVVVDAVDELWRHRILRALPDGYDFSHDLLRDAAYAQVSPPQRWLLHRRLGQSLERLHADDTDSVSAQLAAQNALGGRPDRAVVYYRRAADIASGTFAHAEAIRLHQAALSIVRAQPVGRRSRTEELAILEALAAPLNARYGYASLELQRTLERSIELAETLGSADSTVVALIGLWASQFVQGRTADSHRTASRALDMVTEDSDLSGSAHFAFGGSAVSRGRPAQGLRHLELVPTSTEGARTLPVGTRPDIHGRAWSAHAHWLLGHDAAAVSACRDAVAVARASDHPYNLAVALAYAAITQQMRQDKAELASIVRGLRALCDKYDFAYYREWGLILDGWRQGVGADHTRDVDAGIELAHRGIDNLKAQGSFARMPYWLSLLADLQLARGQPDAARATLDAAVVVARARDDQWWLPEVLRMRSGYDGPPAAIARLRSAAGLASAQGSSALLRRCDHDLAALDAPQAEGAGRNLARTNRP
jgi:DNA-binding SARP family transcriptional activator